MYIGCFVLRNFIKPVTFAHCALMSLYCVIEPVTFARCMLMPFYISHTRETRRMVVRYIYGYIDTGALVPLEELALLAIMSST